MEIQKLNLPILAHRYVPRFEKVGPPIDPNFHEKVKQYGARVGG